ncbi:hypothetical protein C8A01DRAFT_35734 [Parachaetomium inaequale]|uniref:Uncharacterized protein n=1 Tax=Parachaetomium inaequale TaxID=2588326 RepID=A0AAN6SS20_9PEZI|nr:hypothetical protein C8A01DRAFT_35734 [Parachaetomium inaequale]
MVNGKWHERLRRVRNRVFRREDPPPPEATPPAPAPPDPPIFHTPTMPRRLNQPVFQLSSRQPTHYYPPSRLQDNLRGRAPNHAQPGITLPVPQSGTSATMQPLPGCLAAMSSAKTTPVPSAKTTPVPSAKTTPAPSYKAPRARQQQRQQQEQTSPPSSSPSSSAKTRSSSIRSSLLSFRSNRSRGRARLRISHPTCQSAPSLGGLNGQIKQNGQNGQSMHNGQNGQSSSTPSPTTPSK